MEPGLVGLTDLRHRLSERPSRMHLTARRSADSLPRESRAAFAFARTGQTREALGATGFGSDSRASNPAGCRRDLCWNLFGAVSDWMRILDQAARSIGLSASLWVRVCHPST